MPNRTRASSAQQIKKMRASGRWRGAISEHTLIPTYLEIEAESWEDIDKVAQELSLDPEKRKICSANQLYKIYGINTDEYQTINFDEVIKK